MSRVGLLLIAVRTGVSRIWPLIKSFFFVVLVAGFLVGYAPHLVAMIRPDWAVDLGMLKHAAWICWLIGAVTLIYCAWCFGVLAGISPAHNERPKILIVHGPYRYIRNPMYSSQLLIVLGHLFWTGSLTVLIYLINYGIGAYLVATFYEEPLLDRLFGENYRQYRRRVPAWWPSWRHRYVGPDQSGFGI